MAEKYDEALNWGQPNDGLLWSEEQVEDFKQKSHVLYDRICLELGEDYHVEVFGDYF